MQRVGYLFYCLWRTCLHDGLLSAGSTGFYYIESMSAVVLLTSVGYGDIVPCHDCVTAECMSQAKKIDKHI